MQRRFTRLRLGRQGFRILGSNTDAASQKAESNRDSAIDHSRLIYASLRVLQSPLNLNETS